MLREALERVASGAAALRGADAGVRSSMLEALAAGILAQRHEILEANSADCVEHAAALSPSLAERLKLSDEKLDVAIRGLNELTAAQDPLGTVLARTELDHGLILEKVSVPLGVFAVIFESRPDVFLQVLGLALRSGNGVVLKGGREASGTLRAMEHAARKWLARRDMSSEWFLLVEGREAVSDLLQHDDLIDLVIPRGSNEFVRSIQAGSRIPVLGHAAGVCHLYVHSSADRSKAVRIVVDAKTQYPAACNAVETVLVDARAAAEVVPMLCRELELAGVRLHGCDAVCSLVPGVDLVPAEGWSREYGALEMAMKVVSGMPDAVAHINRYGSHHTDAIVAEDADVSEAFIGLVDSACVFANCSTRFADGYRFGFGAEIGIGTGKLHARGPVGIEGLLTYKYVLRGSGQVVSSYAAGGGSQFAFRRLPT